MPACGSRSLKLFSRHAVLILFIRGPRIGSIGVPLAHDGGDDARGRLGDNSEGLGEFVFVAVVQLDVFAGGGDGDALR